MANKYSWGNKTTPVRLHNSPGSSASNCIPAPRSGTFVNTSIEDAQAETMERADAYACDVSRYINGLLPKEQIFRSMSKPIYGAFGERL